MFSALERDQLRRIVKEEISEAFKRPLDRVVICHGDDTDGLPRQNCPHCGKPLVLEGRKTLGMPVDRKAYCEYCPFEENF